MTKFFGFLAIVMLASAGVAPACPSTSAASGIPSFAALPPGSPIYYCSASPAPATVGDLSYAGWARHVQVCTTNCDYRPISPVDPQSPLIAESCGPGWHDQTYFVEPPTASRSTVALKLKNPSCKGEAPSKAPPPSPGPKRG